MKSGSFFLLLSFVNVQLFAFVMGWILISAGVSVTEDPSDVNNSVSLFLTILLTAAVILFILKVYKGKLLFYLLELGLVFTAFGIFFGTMGFGNLVFGANGFDFANVCSGKEIFCIDFSFLGALLAVAARALLKNYRNIFLLFATSIVGALLGASLDIVPAAILAMALSIYDIIAVFYTKHMVTMAKELGNRDAGFSITFPSNFQKNMVVPKVSAEKLRKFYKKVQVNAVELGTGDLALPTMLMVSAMKISPWHAMATMLGSTIGMSLLFFYIEKKKGYWPALPPLIFFGLLFLFLYHILPFKL